MLLLLYTAFNKSMYRIVTIKSVGRIFIVRHVCRKWRRLVFVIYPYVIMYVYIITPGSLPSLYTSHEDFDKSPRAGERRPFASGSSSTPSYHCRGRKKKKKLYGKMYIKKTFESSCSIPSV